MKTTRIRFVIAPLSLLIMCASCIPPEASPVATPEASTPPSNESMTTFEPNWESLAKSEIPEWLKDAKFGVYTHWGIYSVIAKGGAGAPLKSIYKKGLGKLTTYEHYRKHFGKAEDLGYVDIIQMFTAEKFDAEEWVEIMADAGARFGGICVVHHDGFLLWDSEVNRWNSMNKGPKRDIFGEITKAVRARGDMKLAATFHHGRTYGFATGNKLDEWTEEEKAKFDLFDPQYKDFYWHDGHSSREEFSEEWRAKVVEIVDKYQPDFLWFDGLNTSIKNDTPPESYIQEAIAHFLNESAKKGWDVVVANKHAGKFNFPEEFGLLSYENGRQMPEDIGSWFLIDRAIGYPWAWEEGKKYRDGADYHIKSLIDLVSRGGIFLLSLTPKGDGSIPEREKEIMAGIGDWLKINGEAIYGTRPWIIYGEGPNMNLTTMKKSARGEPKMGWDYRKKFTQEDIRFTQSKDGKVLYAITLACPVNEKTLIKSLQKGSEYYRGDIKRISMLGSSAVLKWSRTDIGLEISLPPDRPNEIACAFRIE